MQPFIHLRVTSSYSLCFGALRFNEIAELCKKHKMPAVALSDQGNLFGSLEFSLAMVKEGIQPINAVSLKVDLSSEGIAETDEILLIATNQQGYQNLLKIVSNSYLHNLSLGQNFTNLEELSSNKAGLVALIGYRKGCLYKFAKQQGNKNFAKLISLYQDIFFDDLFIELSRLNEPDEQIAEARFLEIAQNAQLKIVATNDVNYSNPELYEAQDILNCIARNEYSDDPKREKGSTEHYFKNSTSMQQLFADLPEACANTVLIAKKCSFFPETSEPSLPNFATEGRSEKEELEYQSNQGLKQRFTQHHIAAEAQPEYLERLNYELEIINKMGFAGYFLIVSDFIKWSKEQNIPVGPGRGSGAGSMVAWALEITDLDPLRFGLLFERFLNPERVSMPDFDIDFCQERREEVINYVRDKYGAERTAQIITFGKLQAKAVLKDVGRVMQMPYKQVDNICKMVPFNPVNPVTLAQAIEMDPALKKERDSDPQIAKLLDIGLKLEGLHRHASTHAAGIVIATNDLIETIPLYKDPKSELPVVQYSMKYTELSGLVKFDFLGLKTLTVIAKAVEIIKEQGGNIDIEQIPLDDLKTYELLSSGDSIGVFQLESAGMRDCLKKMRPDKLEDIIALISLYRPGPMDNIPKYISCKHGNSAAEYPHPMLEECLKETFGVIIYQEQVMQIAQILAGYSLGEADLLRRAMGKKIKAEMDAQREIFVNGAIKNNIAKAKASEIFDLVAKFAGYGFNKSHAAAYALIGYQTAYLKANFPVEFITATLNLELNDTDKINLFIQEAKKQNITILPPDINKSVALFTVEEYQGQKAVRYGLAALKAVGKSAIDELVALRSGQRLTDIFALLQVAGSKIMQKRLLESLIKSGALDDLEANRAKLLNAIEYLTKYAADFETAKNSAQHSLFGTDTASFENIVLPEQQAFVYKERLQNEFEAFGFYLSEHPLDKFKTLLEQEKIINAAELREVTAASKEITVAGVIISYKQRSGKNGRFVTLNLSDPFGVIDISIFDEELINSIRDILFNGSTIVINATLRNDESGSRIMANRIFSLENFLSSRSKKLQLKISELNEFTKLEQLVANNPGDLPVEISLRYKWQQGEFTINLGKKQLISPEILVELEKIA